MFTPEFFQQVAIAVAIVIPIVEMINRLFKISGGLAVFISILVSILVGGVYGVAQAFAGYEVIVFIFFVILVANGWYKVVHNSWRTKNHGLD